MACRIPKILLACLVAWAGSAAGCEGVDPDAERLKDFQAALPPSAVFELELADGGLPSGPSDGEVETARLPLESDGAAFETKGLALVGQPSAFQAITTSVQLGVRFYLRRVHTSLLSVIDGTEPIFQDSERAVWRRTTPTSTLVLAMRRAEAGYFTYQVLARPVGDPCAPWRVVMAGSYAAEGGDRLRGSGELVMDFDLDDAPETAGQALIVWSRDGQTLRVTTSLHAARLAADGCRRSGVYDYKRNHGGAAAGGLLVFRTFADADRLEPAPCVGTSVASPHPSGGVSAVIMARWAAHGGGRADAILPGPELGDEGWAFERRTECWSPEEHLSTFEERVRFGAEQGVVVQHSEGDPTTCRFTTAGEPFLPPLGEAPERMDPMAGFADLQPARECARR